MEYPGTAFMPELALFWHMFSTQIASAYFSEAPGMLVAHATFPGSLLRKYRGVVEYLQLITLF